MNEEFTKKMYEFVKKNGYKKDYDQFLNTIQDNPEFRDKMHAAVSKKGYTKSLDEFNKSVGYKDIADTVSDVPETITEATAVADVRPEVDAAVTEQNKKKYFTEARKEWGIQNAKAESNPWLFPRVDYANFLETYISENPNPDVSTDDIAGFKIAGGVSDVLSLPGRAIGSSVDALASDNTVGESMTKTKAGDAFYNISGTGDVEEEQPRGFGSEVFQSIIRDPALIPMVLASGGLANATKSAGTKLGTAASKIPYVGTATGKVAEKIPLAAAESVLQEGIGTIEDRYADPSANAGDDPTTMTDRGLNILLGSLGGGLADAGLSAVAEKLKNAAVNAKIKTLDIPFKEKKKEEVRKQMQNILDFDYSVEGDELLKKLGEGRTDLVNLHGKALDAGFEARKVREPNLQSSDFTRIVNDAAAKMVGKNKLMVSDLEDRIGELIKEQQFLNKSEQNKAVKLVNDWLEGQRSVAASNPDGKLMPSDLLSARTTVNKRINWDRERNRLEPLKEQVYKNILAPAITDEIYKNLDTGIEVNSKIFDDLFSENLKGIKATNKPAKQKSFSMDAKQDFAESVGDKNVSGTLPFLVDLFASGGKKRSAIADMMTPSGTRSAAIKNPENYPGSAQYYNMYKQANLPENVFEDTLLKGLLPEASPEYTRSFVSPSRFVKTPLNMLRYNAITSTDDFVNSMLQTDSTNSNKYRNNNSLINN